MDPSKKKSPNGRRTQMSAPERAEGFEKTKREEKHESPSKNMIQRALSRFGKQVSDSQFSERLLPTKHQLYHETS